MVIVHPHYYGRVVARFTDTRGLGRYAAVTLRGKNGVLVTFISVYITPAGGGLDKRLHKAGVSPATHEISPRENRMR